MREGHYGGTEADLGIVEPAGIVEPLAAGRANFQQPSAGVLGLELNGHFNVGRRLADVCQLARIEEAIAVGIDLSDSFARPAQLRSIERNAAILVILAEQVPRQARILQV